MKNRYPREFANTQLIRKDLFWIQNDQNVSEVNLKFLREFVCTIGIEYIRRTNTMLSTRTFEYIPRNDYSQRSQAFENSDH